MLGVVVLEPSEEGAPAQAPQTIAPKSERSKSRVLVSNADDFTDDPVSL